MPFVACFKVRQSLTRVRSIDSKTNHKIFFHKSFIWKNDLVTDLLSKRRNLKIFFVINVIDSFTQDIGFRTPAIMQVPQL